MAVAVICHSRDGHKWSQPHPKGRVIWADLQLHAAGGGNVPKEIQQKLCEKPVVTGHSVN